MWVYWGVNQQKTDEEMGVSTSAEELQNVGIFNNSKQNK
jgi:hypothetical protein